MKCLVCGKEFEGSTKCPVCGFTSAAIVGEQTEEMKRHMKLLAEEHKERILGGTELSIVVYEWQPNKDEILELAEKDYVSFAPCKDMVQGQIYWISEQFARVDGSNVELILAVNKDGNQKEITVSVPIPKGEDFWTVGASLEDGFSVKLHLKTNQQTTQSEEIIIL